MQQKQTNLLTVIAAFFLLIIGVPIVLILAFLGPSGCGMLFMILTGHPM
ncbi:MAG: hypothetical protein ABIQ44_03380 [Chloroflexia bacterium]